MSLKTIITTVAITKTTNSDCTYLLLPFSDDYIKINGVFLFVIYVSLLLLRNLAAMYEKNVDSQKTYRDAKADC